MCAHTRGKKESCSAIVPGAVKHPSPLRVRELGGWCGFIHVGFWLGRHDFLFPVIHQPFQFPGRIGGAGRREFVDGAGRLRARPVREAFFQQGLGIFLEKLACFCPIPKNGGNGSLPEQPGDIGRHYVSDAAVGRTNDVTALDDVPEGNPAA